MKWGLGVLVFFCSVSSITFADMVPFREVLSSEIGPKSEYPLRGFNVNRFDCSRVKQSTPACGQSSSARKSCKELGKNKKICPDKMVFVCSDYFSTAVCVDQDLYNDAYTGRPQGNMNLYACESACAAQGKRIPTNNEWQVACTGSQPSACNTYYSNGGVYPPEYFAQQPGHVCNPASGHGGPYASACMTSPDIVAMLPEIPASCVSDAGVRGCIGTFHQWVSEHFIGAGSNGGFRFNGGSFVVKNASAVDYVTPAHNNEFYHYANGCRCVTSVY